ncbi:hypothetical protein B4Q04_09480 [Zobellia sp. OII3]|uniref:hypothetical protein n=1 Tax=Zobellia sp. OII3 TaxID=2034520 RepID=UPI000B52C15B|nr:hypothetical protein [Zobellia sp. OII3]OWW25814.1 hypothetical protein B4Q04_09480 [Zobellia sp. OII3]
MWYLYSGNDRTENPFLDQGEEVLDTVIANVNRSLKMKEIPRKTLGNNFSVRLIGLMCAGLVGWGCTSTKRHGQEPAPQEPMEKTVQVHANPGADVAQDYGFHVHEYINLGTRPTPSELDSLLPKDNITEKLKEAAWKAFFESASPVAQKIVENYLASKNKEPGGHCLAISKRRIEEAYRQVHGHSLYQDLPERMATKMYRPKQVFDLLYVSASDTDRDWKSLPEAYRGKGNAGALAYAGMGTLVDSTGIWGGELRPGAPMQVWRYKEDYEQVVKGTDVKKLDPYGHSFIFIDYVRDENNKIVGLKIADQGFQSYRPLIPSDYDVWWAVNLNV